MALTENTRPYEVLLRIHSDGTVGAQKQSITEISRNGEVITAVVNPPEELSESEMALAQQLANEV
ncbi:hypothetical protein F2A38_15745 [Pseudomonas chlororaphis]|uniref:Uncharacterized protein n=1 Tax=Pseudomonas chlororaphis TaxID=587753 RepID=A0AB34C8N5_9PSED|nr:hypothetical protein [Pseudomonas chlororaphis]KAA5841984.1 hypothetical protein F2A38_15745 [Pseudomonas chlororaphis]